MKPLKNISGLASWMMRLALLATLLLLFFPVFIGLKINTLEFYVATVFLVFGALLFVGGFFSTPMTVVSSLILFLLAVYKSFITFDGKLTGEVACWLLFLSICAYFITHGNK